MSFNKSARYLLMELNQLQARKLTPDALLPVRSHPSDAGADLFSNEDVFIAAGSSFTVSTGIAINVPEGFVGKIEGRSSLAAQGLQTLGGVVDAGYSGEVKVVLANLSNTNALEPITLRRGWRVRKGDKIAQMLLYSVETPAIVEVTEAWTSDRGSKGWGSSDGNKGTT